MSFTLYKSNISKSAQIVKNLSLESTRLFLTKNNDFSKLVYSDGNLHYDSNLLLDAISKYKLALDDKIATIDICIRANTICQVWKIKIQ